MYVCLCYHSYSIYFHTDKNINNETILKIIYLSNNVIDSDMFEIDPFYGSMTLRNNCLFLHKCLSSFGSLD